MKILDYITRGFPAWVLTASVIALAYPPSFTWFSGNLITVGLGIIMLGMGVTLTVDDFRRVVKFPGRVLAGVCLQFGVMPLLGWSIAYIYDLPTPLAVGLILVASCPGGTASNVIAYLAKADVPLSVTMTSITTMLAIVATPFFTALLAGSRVDVPAFGLFLTTVQVILLPVTAGVLMNRYLSRFTKAVKPAMPLVAVIFITLIVASIIGAGRDHILEAGWKLIAAVFSLHAGGFLMGYIMAFIVTRDVITARTISIEVGMQNSGLGVVLARNNFADPVTAIPSAISSLFHSIIASLVAALWRRSAHTYRETAPDEANGTEVNRGIPE
ncbi:MAG TPA: bile acid:sodium symporter family protein [Spirochaetota bacterium]|nr:bile acid:sodium symporter family protein [Spirochaetota bacterium]HPV40553.1 bile acid:sodium symporter family protein [Spirochaetota bacterium]